jgi:prepilin-type processing-associated H-X9-DG protein/prepilin-type N-terminal cleavage/methylation domain-containing protein
MRGAMEKRGGAVGGMGANPFFTGSSAAFTMVELLVVVAIIAILIAILIPVISAVREQSRVTACLANLRQIGHAISMYGVDHKGLILPADLRDPNFDNVNVRWGNWATILVQGKYLSAPDQSNSATPAQSSVLRCPNGTDEDGVFNGAYFSERQSLLQAGYWRRQAMNLHPDGSMTPSITIFTWYGINADRVGEEYPFFRYPSDTRREKLHSFSEIRSPSELAMVYDGFFEHGGEARLMANARHKNRTMTNYLFADGHAGSVETRMLPVSFEDGDLDARPFPKYKLRQK